MIAYLSGLLLRKTTQSVIIDAGGIGYEVFVPLSTFYTLPGKDERVSLHIHTHVREDALTLFGFYTRLEKDLFLMLNSVSGIGPRLAVNILSGIGPNELLQAIARGDAIRIQAIPGVGKKTAERIALELKDKALRFNENQEVISVPVYEEGEGDLAEDARSALLNLGYSARLAEQAVNKAKSGLQEATLEGLIRESLKILA